MIAFFSARILSFLRCSEFAVRSLNGHAEYLEVKDVEICPDNSMFTFFSSRIKIRPISERHESSVFPECVLVLDVEYEIILRKRQEKTVYSNEPLFVDFNNKPCSRDSFIYFVTQLHWSLPACWSSNRGLFGGYRRQSYKDFGSLKFVWLY